MIETLICERKTPSAVSQGLIDELLSGMPIDEKSLSRRLQLVGLATWPRLALLLAIPAKAESHRSSYGDLAELAGRCTGDKVALLAVPRGPHQVLLLVAPQSPGSREETRERVRVFSDSLRDEVYRRLGVAAVVGVGGIVAEPGHLSRSVVQARRACSRAAFLGAGRIVFEEEALALAAANHYPIDLERELCARIRAGQRDAALDLVPDLISGIVRSTGADPKETKVRAGELTAVVSRAALEAGGDAESVTARSCAVARKLSLVGSIGGLRQWLRDVLAAFADDVAGRRPREQRLVDKAVSFIRDNFAAELTLQCVAEVVHVSPYYLSHLFRKQCNCTFLECLTRSRVEEAKRLLTQSSLAINQVGSAVGYTDANYFAQVFRRVTGITPSAYRRNVAGSSAKRSATTDRRQRTAPAQQERLVTQ